MISRIARVPGLLLLVNVRMYQKCDIQGVHWEIYSCVLKTHLTSTAKLMKADVHIWREPDESYLIMADYDRIVIIWKILKRRHGRRWYLRTSFFFIKTVSSSVKSERSRAKYSEFFTWNHIVSHTILAGWAGTQLTSVRWVQLAAHACFQYCRRRGYRQVYCVEVIPHALNASDMVATFGRCCDHCHGTLLDTDKDFIHLDSFFFGT